HATLSPSWKKSLLLALASAVAFATATSTTAREQCFFQGLGFSANGVSANGTVVVGQASAQAVRWTAASGMVGLGFLPGALFSDATGVNAEARSWSVIA